MGNPIFKQLVNSPDAEKHDNGAPAMRQRIISALSDALAALKVPPPGSIELGRPANPTHGDLSSNVALAAGAAVGRNPRRLAVELAERIGERPPLHVRRVEAAGAGFVNFYLHEAWLHEVLRKVLKLGEKGYARWDFGSGVRVNVEFVSANPTGPLHLGGGRWAAYGDALCNILSRCGYSVHREYYLNDRGRQMEAFAASLTARRCGKEPPEDGYHGDYITAWADEMPADADPLEWGYARARRDVSASLDRLGVTFDTWFSERSLAEAGDVERSLAELRRAGVVYEHDGALWLRSGEFGDDKDRVLVRSDGEATYLLGDVAYHQNKFSRGFDILINVWGSDHHGYVERLAAGMRALGHSREQLEIVLGQLVKVMRGGRESRISKRAGDLLLLDDLVDLLGADATRMTFLLQSLDKRQVIDLDLAASQSMENPVFYVQYAHARICSLLREASDRGMSRPPLEETALEVLDHPRELALLRTLGELPDVVAAAAAERAPHKLTTWVRDLAGDFHGFYHDCPVLSSGVPSPVRGGRLWLTEAARIGLVIALRLLGVSAPRSM